MVKLFAIGLLFVQLSLVGCGRTNSPKSGSSTIPVTTTTKSPTTLASADPTPNGHGSYQATSIDEFVGSWYAHSIGLEITRSGEGRMVWRTYNDCRADPPPCDRFDGGLITSGGQASIHLSGIEDGLGVGTVNGTTDPEALPDGPLILRLDPSNNYLYLGPWKSDELRLCGTQGSRSPEGTC